MEHRYNTCDRCGTKIYDESFYKFANFVNKKRKIYKLQKRNYKLKTYETIEDSTLIDNAMFITYNKISYFDIQEKECELCYKCAKKYNKILNDFLKNKQ